MRLGCTERVKKRRAYKLLRKKIIGKKIMAAD
jgi:hypothetical protein